MGRDAGKVALMANGIGDGAELRLTIGAMCALQLVCRSIYKLVAS